MNNIFIIGSNSFSGASFAGHALKNGANVVGISRSKEANFPFLPYKWENHSNFTFRSLDLNQNLEEIITLINELKPTHIVNFAAQSMVGESWINPADWFMTNVVSTINLHDNLRKCDFLKRYIHISTPEVYGTCSGFVDEEFPFNPSTPYAVPRSLSNVLLTPAPTSSSKTSLASTIMVRPSSNSFFCPPDKFPANSLDKCVRFKKSTTS